MPIRVEPLSSIVYWYDGPAFEPHLTPYTAVATLLWETPEKVTIRGLHGHMTREMRDELRTALRDAGVKTVRAERHGRELLWSVADGAPGHVTSGGTGGE